MLLQEIDLETLAPKLEALGVRGLNDLALVDDADLVRWGLSTIQRRRFFGYYLLVLLLPGRLFGTPVGHNESQQGQGQSQGLGRGQDHL